MLLEIANVLSSTQCAQLRERIGQAQFVDGRESAGAQAARGKLNRELPAALATELSPAILSPLNAHPQFQAAVMPARLSSATIAQYIEGMHYDAHTDDPVMGAPGGRYRSDVAITIMLSEGGDFEGGALSIQTAFGPQRVQLAEGAAVVYPASSIHAVERVKRGTRLVAVAWAQSMVRAPEKRQVLFDLWRVRESLRASVPEAKVSTETDRVYTNLVRMWAEL